MVGQNSVNRIRVSIAGCEGRALPVHVGIRRGPSTESVHIPIEHAKTRGNEHGVVDLEVGGAARPGARDGIAGYFLSAALHLAGNGK